MRNWVMIAGSGLALAACGGGGGSGSQPVAVVPGGTTPTPAPTPTPAATPTPTPGATPTPTPGATPTPSPTPSSAYPRYADLTGNRSFQTACASLLLTGGVPKPQPALPFGGALTLDYAASTGGYAIGGDGVSLSFGSGDAVAGAAGEHGYQRSVGGSAQRFTISDVAAGGSTLDFTRSFSLRTDRSAGSTLYSCVFGVPASASDRPTAAISYGRVGVNGTAYVADPAGGVQSSVLTASTATMGYDPSTNAVVVKVHLVGNLQTSSGVASTTTDLGTFSTTAAVDAARLSFSGQVDGTDRVSLFSSLSGWFFGGTEAASSFEILAADPNGGGRVAAVGTVFGSR